MVQTVQAHMYLKALQFFASLILLYLLLSLRNLVSGNYFDSKIRLFLRLRYVILIWRQFDDFRFFLLSVLHNFIIDQFLIRRSLLSALRQLVHFIILSAIEMIRVNIIFITVPRAL